MDENDVLRIEFGMFYEFSMEKGSSRFHSVLKINKFEYIAGAPKCFVKFEKGVIKKVYNVPSVCMYYIEIYDAVVLITPPPTKMKIYFVSDLYEPVIDDIPVQQIGICHMKYSERNKILMTFGIGVDTWLFDMIPAIYRKSKIDMLGTVTHLKHFALGYSANMLSDPCWIEKKNELVLPTKDGLVRFDLNGKMLGSPVSLISNNFTLYLYNTNNDKAITSSVDQGLLKWGTNGRMTHHYTCITTPVFVAFFMTNEFLITYDSSMFLSIIDLKTERCFPMVKLYPRPDRIFFERSPGQPTRVIVCSQNKIDVYRVIVPWSLWKRTATAPKYIERCPRANGAARIAVLLRDASIRFFSPVTRKLLTLCHSKETGFPSSMLMDRGTINFQSRDQLFITFDNGKIAIFGTNEEILEPVAMLDIKASCCGLAMYCGNWCLLIGTKTGDVIVYSYTTLTYMKRFGFVKKCINRIYYHENTDSIFILYDDEVIRMKSNGSEKYEYSYPYGTVSAILGDLLAIGYENGSFLISKIECKEMVLIHNREKPLHRGRVSALTSGKSFFVSAGYDGSILIWTMECEVIIEIFLPLPISSAAFLNGKRGLLIGTESEIMIINGSSLFGKFVDPVDPLFDNYDTKVDDSVWMPQVFSRECDEEEDMGFLDLLKGKYRLLTMNNKKGGENGEEEDDDEKIKLAKKKSLLLNINIGKDGKSKNKRDIKKEKTKEDLAAIAELEKIMDMPPTSGGDDSKSKDQKKEEDEYVYEEEEEEFDEDDDENAKGKNRNKKKKEEKIKKKEEDDETNENNEPLETNDVDNEEWERPEPKQNKIKITDPRKSPSYSLSFSKNKNKSNNNNNSRESGSNNRERSEKMHSKDDEFSNTGTSVTKLNESKRNVRQLLSNNVNKGKKSNKDEAKEAKEKDAKMKVVKLKLSTKSSKRNAVGSNKRSESEEKSHSTKNKKSSESDNVRKGKSSTKGRRSGKSGKDGKDGKDGRNTSRRRKIKESDKENRLNDAQSKENRLYSMQSRDSKTNEMHKRGKDNELNKRSGYYYNDANRSFDENGFSQNKGFGKQMLGSPSGKRSQAIPRSPTAEIRSRNPRMVILKEKEKIGFDRDALDVQPRLFFDKDIYTQMMREQRPEGVSILKKLNCFQREENADGSPLGNSPLGVLDEKSRHFCLSKPRYILKAQEEDMSDTENILDDNEYATVFSLKKDPPPLVEAPPYIERIEGQAQFVLPPLREFYESEPGQRPETERLERPQTGRTQTGRSSSPSVWEKMERPQTGRPYSPSVRERKQFLNDVKEVAKARNVVAPPELRAPRNIGSYSGKQKFNDLVAIFNRVHRKKRVVLSSRKIVN